MLTRIRLLTARPVGEFFADRTSRWDSNERGFIPFDTLAAVATYQKTIGGAMGAAGVGIVGTRLHLFFVKSNGWGLFWEHWDLD